MPSVSSIFVLEITFSLLSVAANSDQIPAIVLTHCALEFGPILIRLYQIPYDSAIFPIIGPALFHYAH